MEGPDPKIEPPETAPRDGTVIYVIDRGHQGYGPEAIMARVPDWWLVDEFVPSSVPDGDFDGANHGAIPNESIVGWASLDQREALAAAGILEE